MQIYLYSLRLLEILHYLCSTIFENAKAMVSNNNTDPTPAPPLEGRGEATARRTKPLGTPLQGEGQGWGLKL